MHYVLSDIHGESAAFDAILDLIQMNKADRLYIIGDVIDRGPDGIALLQRIRRMPNATMLLGNHEYMMIDALQHRDDDMAIMRWWRNGCEETFRCFYDLDAEAREDLLLYLESLPVQMMVLAGQREYLLVHAAPVELYEAGQWKIEREFAVWKRIPMASPRLLSDRAIVIGHTPTSHVQRADWPWMRIAHGDGVIDLDCGYAFPDHGGQLGCLRLEDMTEYYSREGVVTKRESAEWKVLHVRV